MFLDRVTLSEALGQVEAEFRGLVSQSKSELRTSYSSPEIEEKVARLQSVWKSLESHRENTR